MKLLYTDISDEGLGISFRKNDSSWEGLKGLTVKEWPYGELFIEKFDRDIFIKGHGRAVLSFTCSRCLERFDLTLDVAIQQTLRPSTLSDNNRTEMELRPNDLEFSFYDGNIIYLDSLIEEHLLVTIPMKPLCKTGCQGLCPQCGLNQNDKSCTCPKNHRESPFDCLKDIFQ